MEIHICPNFTFGFPKPKILYEWITKIDLEPWNILLKDPIYIRNFLTQYTDYTTDLAQFNVEEYWQNPNNIMKTGKDDCEGINNLACNILYTLGYDCRFCLGCFNRKNFEIEPEKRFINHAYGLLYTDDIIDNPYIIDCTGDDIISKFTHINDDQSYYTLYMGSKILQKTFACNHLTRTYI